MTTASSSDSGTQDPSDQLGVAERLVSSSIATTLGLIAAARRGKAVHCDGVVYDAVLAVSGVPEAPPAQLLSQPGEHRAVVRFSRALGLPRLIPDLMGMSIRVIDAYGRGRHQDLLLISSVDRPVLHHLFVPARDVWQRPYTSSLPFRAGAARFLIGALPRLASPAPSGRDEFERLGVAARRHQLHFELAVASLGGRFDSVIAGLRIGEELPRALDALRFNPWNTGGGLEPAGWLNAARYASYRRSQQAWRGAKPDGGAREDSAEAVVRRS